METGLKLAQTLWRKVLPEEIDDADNHLSNEVYRCLLEEAWKRGQVYAEFAISQRNISDFARKMATVNCAIALKFGGEPERAIDLLKKTDWTGSASEFQLAKAVLEDRFAEAGSLVRGIGKGSELLRQENYHRWPLFREFRSSPEFLQAYRDVYGEPFESELKKSAETAELTGPESIPQQNQEKQKQQIPNEQVLEQVENENSRNLKRLPSANRTKTRRGDKGQAGRRPAREKWPRVRLGRGTK